MRACALLAGESRTFLLPVGKSQPFERKKSEIPSPSLPCCHKLSRGHIWKLPVVPAATARIWKLVCKFVSILTKYIVIDFCQTISSMFGTFARLS